MTSDRRFAWAWLAALAGFLVVSLCGAALQAREVRIALVIGNSAYSNAEVLKNPVNDARAMATALTAAGFEVILRENATRRAFVEALHEFAGKVPPGGVGLFYFAGHGLQVRGVNYLLPVDVALANEYDLKYESIDVNDVLDRLEESRARLSLVVLDACRNNPFTRRFRATTRGLAQTDAPRGTVIAYATAPGDTAADGDGDNGVYTAELLKAMAVPGLTLEEVFKRTIDGVAAATASKQTPWVSSSFRGDFYFHPAAAAATNTAPGAAPSAASPEALELAAWSAIAGSSNPAMFEVFLKRFPDGVYADFARARLTELQAAAAAPAPSSAATDEQREMALKLSELDRRRIQAALTTQGFDTMGTDGVLGPRSRQMIANWQRARAESPTGFLTAAQAALLSKDGDAALDRLEEERRKAAPQISSVAPAGPTTSFEGRWAGQVCRNDACRPANMQIAKNRLSGVAVGKGSPQTLDGAIEADGQVRMRYAGIAPPGTPRAGNPFDHTLTGRIEGDTLTASSNYPGGVTFRLTARRLP
ncbi:MAG: caspase family protein [Alphaproteobacteria bacterium]|nr:caspase family protein [Alphaproteobacteria bacterium]MCW5740896.1 caspase family protein [Alphaproteobacteria bacterium]